MAEEDKKVSGARMSLFKQLLDGLFVTKAAMTTAISTLSSTIAGKVDKVDGKGLSANDYTASDKTKLSGLANIKTVGDGLNLTNGNLVGVVVTGATATNAGKRGIVPAPYPGDQDRFLKGNGSWAIPPNTTYEAATGTVPGLMSAADKNKLDSIATGANKYSLPTATTSVLGGVKTGANITNTVGTISLTKSNVVNALGYTPPTSDTTYTAGENISIDGTIISAAVPPATITDTTANWTTNNTVLQAEQIGIELTISGSRRAKVGDGKTAWAALPYISSPSDVTLSIQQTDGHWLEVPYEEVAISTTEPKDGNLWLEIINEGE